MTNEYVNLKYRIVHFYDKEMYRKSDTAFQKDIFNGGVFIKGDKLYQSKKFNDELVIVEVFQENSIENIPDYFLQVFCPIYKLQMIMIEEL
jgi:hypothetical protein